MGGIVRKTGLVRLLIAATVAMLTIGAAAQTPADEALMRWQGGINETRVERLLTLEPQVIPDCSIAPTTQDVAEFYVFWRSAVQQEIDQHKALGWPLVDSDEEKRREESKQFGFTTLRQYQLLELVQIGPQVSNADESAKLQIGIWKALHCVVEKYGTEKLFSSNGSVAWGMAWPFDPILSAFGHDLLPVDPDRTKAYRVPNLMDLEPLDALGRFFRAAQAKGLLTFNDADEEQYFFERYEGDYFFNITDAAKARAWFRTPPWKPDAPHLERPTRPITPRVEFPELSQHRNDHDDCISWKGHDPFGACSRVIQSGAQFPEWLSFAYKRRATAYSKKGDFLSAIQDLDQAIKLDPDDALAFAGRGDTYDQLGQHDRAIKDFDKAIALSPNNGDIYVNRGIILGEQGEYALAIQDFDKAIKLNPSNGAAFFDRGYAYDALKDYESASKDYERAMALNPQDAKAISHHGHDCERLKRYEEAIKDLNRALTLRPDAIDFWYRGVAYAHMNEYERAIQDYDQAIKLEPDDAYSFSSRGDAYRHLKRYTEALSDYDKAITLKHDLASTYVRRAMVYLETKEFVRALQDDSKAIELGPEDAVAFNNRCWVRAVWGQELDMALDDCTKAVTLKPDDWYSRGSRAFVYLRKGQYMASIKDADAAIALDANDADAWLIRGIAKRKSGDEEGGHADIAAAEKLDPKIAETYAGYGIPL